LTRKPWSNEGGLYLNKTENSNHEGGLRARAAVRCGGSVTSKRGPLGAKKEKELYRLEPMKPPNAERKPIRQKVKNPITLDIIMISRTPSRTFRGKKNCLQKERV